MKHTASVRVSGIAACFLLLLAAGAFSMSENQAKASQACTNETIEAALSNPPSPFRPFPNLKARVRDGVVRVRGMIENSADKRNVETIVKSVPCVRGSNLSVDTNGLEINCSGANPQDNVNRQLSTLPCAIRSSIDAKARGDVVILTGSVPSADKEAVRRTFEVADCVRRVNDNRLNVTSSPAFSGDCSAIPGPQLKEMVEAAIRSKFSCGVRDAVKVDPTNDGVRLTGNVDSSNQRDRIVKVARSVCPTATVTNGLSAPSLIPGPECPPGALNCTGLDGESYCCTGCRVCPAG